MGIVRKVDVLGRIGIPVEIRRTMNIKFDDLLEISRYNENELVIRKYSLLASYEKYSETAVKCLNETTGLIAIVCDRDKVLTACGKGTKQFIGKEISTEVSNLMNYYNSYVSNNADNKIIPLLKENIEGITSEIIIPVISRGDCLGAVMLISKDGIIDPNVIPVVKITAEMISKQFE